MDRSAWTTQIAKLKAASKTALLWMGGGLLGVILLTTLVRFGPEIWKNTKVVGTAVVDYLSIRELYEIYAQAFQSVQDKVDALKDAEEQARVLAAENARLKLEKEATQFACQSASAEKTTRKLASELTVKTGMPMGRIPESISYRPPESLTPTQLLTLGRSYFKDREDEKAAVIFSALTSLDAAKFQTAEIHLLAGISWYRVDHIELANSHFDTVLAKAALPENLRYQAHSRLWKALASAKQGKRLKTQYWLRELVDHHPHSREAGWVNSGGAKRAPASAK